MSDWNPYGLEKYRTQGSGKRSWVLLALLVAGVALWMFLTLGQTNTSYNVGIGTGNANSLSLTPPKTGPTPMTVVVSPGQVAVASTPTSSGGGSTVPNYVSPDSAYPILGWIVEYGPLAIAPWLVWKFITRPSKTEVNYGIFKGAMPPEAILSSPPRIVRSKRAVEEPLFGRKRADYVGDLIE
ncbi:MAG: hypothetical protein ACYDDF_13445 [Thermoplasmatota archaeon]